MYVPGLCRLLKEFIWSSLELRTSQTSVICHLFITWCNINDDLFNDFIQWLTKMIVRLLKVRFPSEQKSWYLLCRLWTRRRPINVVHDSSSYSPDELVCSKYILIKARRRKVRTMVFWTMVNHGFTVRYHKWRYYINLRVLDLRHFLLRISSNLDPAEGFVLS